MRFMKPIAGLAALGLALLLLVPAGTSASDDAAARGPAMAACACGFNGP